MSKTTHKYSSRRIFFFSLIYNYCQDYNNAQARGQVAGEELYMKIKEYLINHLTKIFNVKFRGKTNFKYILKSNFVRIVKMYKMTVSYVFMHNNGININRLVKYSMQFVYT